MGLFKRLRHSLSCHAREAWRVASDSTFFAACASSRICTSPPDPVTRPWTDVELREPPTLLRYCRPAFSSSSRYQSGLNTSWYQGDSTTRRLKREKSSERRSSTDAERNWVVGRCSQSQQGQSTEAIRDFVCRGGKFTMRKRISAMVR